MQLGAQPVPTHARTWAQVLQCGVAYIVSFWRQAHPLPSHSAPPPGLPKNHRIPRTVGCDGRNEDMVPSLPTVDGGPCCSSWARSLPHIGHLEGYIESVRPWSGRNTCGRTRDRHSGSFSTSKQPLPRAPDQSTLMARSVSLPERVCLDLDRPHRPEIGPPQRLKGPAPRK